MAEPAVEPDLTARCHCGAVSITLPCKPDRVVQCNCTICTALAWRCVYFPSEELTIEGRFDEYVRSDIKEPFLKMMRCANCGVATHWEPLTPPPHERMGINANLLDPQALDEAEVVPVDGRSWAL